MDKILPDRRQRKIIDDAVQAQINLCWTCGGCETECPINIATNRLHPRKIVWMAKLGLLDELIRLPEIWYCLTCNRCSFICPMTVKPSLLILYLRKEAVRREILSHDMVLKHKDLFYGFQRVRWHIFYSEEKSSIEDILHSNWHMWIKTPLQQVSTNTPIHLKELGFNKSRAAAPGTNSALCLTCRECASACPVICELRVFNPVWIFRMANLGLYDELLSSPSIWLCVGCQNCTNACSQLVRGHQIIQKLRQLAVEKGYVDQWFFLRWGKSHKMLYNHLLQAIDELLTK